MFVCMFILAPYENIAIPSVVRAMLSRFSLYQYLKEPWGPFLESPETFRAHFG